MLNSKENYQAIHAERLYEKIVGQIERRILSGELKVGDQLPSERELSEQFGVSRTAVREAVKTLVEQGLVEVRPGRGTFITNSTSQAARHTLGLMMKIGQSGNSKDLVEVREIFEPEIAALAATRATEEHIAALREAVETMDASLEDPEAYIEADLDFHLALAEASRNILIPTLIDFIVDLLREQRQRIFVVNGGPQRGQFHHKRILQAVIDRNPKAARDQMRLHLQQVSDDSSSDDPNPS
jgi:GntR family transcriptional repressor for pyruvate dehydrogenase complex